MKFSPFQRPALLVVLLLLLLLLIAVLGVKPAADSRRAEKTPEHEQAPQAGNFTDPPEAAVAGPVISGAAGGAIAPGSPGRPAVKLSETLSAAMSRETSDLEVITHPDGRRSVDLKGRFSHMSASVTTPDGRRVVQCFSDAESLAAALSTHPSAK